MQSHFPSRSSLSLTVDQLPLAQDLYFIPQHQWPSKTLFDIAGITLGSQRYGEAHKGRLHGQRIRNIHKTSGRCIKCTAEPCHMDDTAPGPLPLGRPSSRNTDNDPALRPTNAHQPAKQISPTLRQSFFDLYLVPLPANEDVAASRE